MNRLRLLVPVLALCTTVALVVTGCSDEPEEPGGLNVEEPDNDDEENDQEEDEDGLQLQGELVPAGQTALGEELTLSGHIVPGYERTGAESESYQLELEPAPITGKLPGSDE